MLILTRRSKEIIRIGDDIEVTVLPSLATRCVLVNSQRGGDTVDRLNYLDEYLDKNLESMNIGKAINLNRASPISRPNSKFKNEHSVFFSTNDFWFWVAMSQKQRIEPACYGA